MDDDADTVIIPSALNVVIGIWLALSPLILGFDHSDPRVQPIIGGALITLLACVRAARTVQTAALSWANACLGIWLLATALLAASEPIAAVNLGFCGALVAVLATISALRYPD